MLKYLLWSKLRIYTMPLPQFSLHHIYQPWFSVERDSTRVWPPMVRATGGHVRGYLWQRFYVINCLYSYVLITKHCQRWELGRFLFWNCRYRYNNKYTKRQIIVFVFKYEKINVTRHLSVSSLLCLPLCIWPHASFFYKY